MNSCCIIFCIFRILITTAASILSHKGTLVMDYTLREPRNVKDYFENKHRQFICLLVCEVNCVFSMNMGVELLDLNAEFCANKNPISIKHPVISHLYVIPTKDVSEADLRPNQ